MCGCNIAAMRSTKFSPKNIPAGKQPSVPSASSNQAAIAASPTRAGVTRNAWAFYLTQGASSVSMKLITERANITGPVLHEIRESLYGSHVHGGINE